jgi:hypothetical protein
MKKPIDDLITAGLGALLGGGIAVAYVARNAEAEGFMALYFVTPFGAFVGAMLAMWMRNLWRRAR